MDSGKRSVVQNSTYVEKYYTSSPESTNSSEGSPSPVAPNAPKFGTLVPNRIFVGGISASTTEAELSSLFSQYGNVKATKIISDRAGVSKGYGFITFETEEEAKRIQKEADNIVLKDRKLNIAPAIKKQPFTRVYADPAQSTQNGTVMYSNGVPYMYVYHNGMALFTTATADGVYQVPQTQAAYSPVIYPPTIYIPQQYSYQVPGPGLPSPSYMYATATSPAALSPSQTSSSSSSANPNQTSGNSSTCTTTTTSNLASICSPAVASAGDTYSYPTPGLHQYAFPAPAAYFHQPLTTAHVEYAEPDVSEGKPNNCKYKGSPHSYSAANGSTMMSPSKSYGSHRPVRLGPTTLLPTPNGGGDPSRTVRQIQSQQPHLVAKQVNGVTVMAYSNPLVMSTVPVSPNTPYQRECNPYEESGNMTPPPTPLTPAGTPNVESIFKS